MANISAENIPASVRRALDQVCVQLDYKTYRYRFERGAGDGDGTTSVITRVYIDGECNGISKRISLICKYQPSDQAHRDKFNSAALFAREVLVFTQVIPEFDKIQAEYNILLDDGFFAYPKCYYASHSGDEIILVLEDLVARNFIMDPTVESYHHESARLVYTQLGRLHALSFALRAHKPDVFNKFKPLDDILHKVMTTDTFKPLSKKAIEVVASILDPNEVDLKQTILKYKDSLWDEMATKVLNGAVAEPYSVINHADCWLNNLMFRYQNGTPIELILIDYQHTRYCSPAIDLINFTFSRGTSEIRNNHFEYFINVYYKSFQTMLHRFGLDPDTTFPFRVLQSHLKRFGIIGFALATFTIPLNCGVDLYNMPPTNSPEYQNFKIEMGCRVRDIYNFGYFDNAQ